MPSPNETLSKTFERHEAEKRVYALWEENNLFRADPARPGEPFVIVIPPPNVTGNLHMGHALDNTLQDALIRFHRMLGDNTLWIPGTDHAGIATQAVVERSLAAEGVTRQELGREKFLEKVWAWKEEFGGKIIGQLKRLGASCDWSRERFTMDAGLSRAVREVFVTLYEDGLIRQEDYVINWCPRCQTALSDIEVEREDREGTLYYIVYEGVDGAPPLTVATTRPETVFADVAVAVNPQDARYRDHKFVKVPFVNRAVPVIFDSYVDMEFGTGALKVTPAHDGNDFKIGKRHDLPIFSCVDKDGRLNRETGPYEGLDRFASRAVILADLEAKGLLAKTEPLQHALGVCYRCRTPIEPLLSLQWFVKTESLAKSAADAVRDGRIKIVPSSWENTFFNWMDNIRDWCVSRQLWWGHQIPAWKCASCGKTHVLREDPTDCPDCHGPLARDPDVLDTWFSSGLWPFSTLGWPDETEDLKRYYPTTVLVTGFDIIFFWVARMMMMGLKIMKEVPFRTVVLHPLVRDASGQKMSKSKGNVIDPLTIIDEYGADAFRFTLASQAGSGRDLKLSAERVAGYSRFITKLWNAARFALPLLQGPPPTPLPKPQTLPDQWIRSRLAVATMAVNAALREFSFDRAAETLYHFIWDEFCDWYLELAKPLLYGDDPKLKESAAQNLYAVFSETLALLHPIAPFVTEELYSRLPGAKGFLMVAPFPRGRAEDRDEAAEKNVGYLMDVCRAVRQTRADFGLAPGAKVAPVVQSSDGEILSLLRERAPLLLKLMGASSLSFSGDPGAKPADAATVIHAWGEVWTPLAGQIDLEAEMGKRLKEIAKLEKELAAARQKLQNPAYVRKAPPEIVEETREKLASAEIRLQSAQRSRDLIGDLTRAAR
ncbi:MAG: valine--tRNA ligase [Deltaproteobacteria bacterium]|jgi:valyl-tRNA synthetase|nr:valine--tRNA ligase [Deltaproteobacteria bacterium]